MKKLLLLILLLLSTSAFSGEHLRTKTFSFLRHPKLSNVAPGETVTIRQPINSIDGTEAWLAVYSDSRITSAGPNVWLRYLIRNTDNGEWYYMSGLQKGQSNHFTFPIPVHEFHNLELVTKCINASNKVARCDGYLLIYAR